MKKHHMTPTQPAPGQFQSKDPAKNMTIAGFRTDMNLWFKVAVIAVFDARLVAETNQGQSGVPDQVDGSDEANRDHGDVNHAVSDWANKWGAAPLNIEVKLKPGQEADNNNWINAAQFDAEFETALFNDGGVDEVSVEDGEMAQLLRKYFPGINLHALASQIPD